jgi:hypothetical protein
MNKELRGAIYKKKLYHNKFLQNKSDANFDLMPLFDKNGLMVE